MRLRKRGSAWYVDAILSDGSRLRVSTDETDESAARKRAPVLIAEAEAKLSDRVFKVRQVLECMYTEHWRGTKSDRVMRHMVNRLTRDIGEWTLPECTYRALRQYCEDLKKEGLAPATINRRMSCVSGALREEARRSDGAFVCPDIPHFEEDNVKERYMTDAEEQAVNGWLKTKAMADNYGTPGTGEWIFMRGLFRVLVDTGMRFSETFIAVEEGGVLRLRHGDTKSGKARSIPMTTRAAKAWAYMHASPWMEKLRHDPNAWAWCDHRWKQAVKAAGCSDITLHILRHTCASRLIQRGVDIYTVSKWLGHSSVKVTERYSHLAPSSLERALSALQGGPVGINTGGTDGSRESDEAGRAARA